MSADAIAALTGGRATANTVRSWWRSGALEYAVFPELGTKSNKRSDRQNVEQFLRRKYGSLVQEPTSIPHPAVRVPVIAGQPPEAGAIADLLDTLSSVKAAADATMQALITEAEANAVRSQAIAESDAKRVETLKHLQTMMRGYDLALATHLQPAAPDVATVDDPT
jgi:alkanesulfonate monooxygenase SsuD/methylene tetrahydromethanopterin reductase-like flavin-dependent oxidoreductase (luciferase family)